jgi:hypothetical protein
VSAWPWPASWSSTSNGRRRIFTPSHTTSRAADGCSARRAYRIGPTTCGPPAGRRGRARCTELSCGCAFFVLLQAGVNADLGFPLPPGLPVAREHSAAGVAGPISYGAGAPLRAVDRYWTRMRWLGGASRGSGLGWRRRRIRMFPHRRTRWAHPLRSSRALHSRPRGLARSAVRNEGIELWARTCACTAVQNDSGLRRGTRSPLEPEMV